MALTDGQKEQIKLGATYLNGIAIGLFIVGGLSIPATILLDPPWRFSPLFVFGFSLFCICSSIALHLGARRSLRRLDQ